MINEIWKDVKGYEGLYQVSNLGRAKSLGRKNCSNICLKDKILNPSLDHKNGYKRVCLCRNNNEKRVGIHRLVAEVFIPNPENKPCVNHKDGNKLNNRVDNLEWCTAKENNQHAIKTGLVDIEKRKNIMREIGKRNYKNNGKKIKQYSKNGNLIKTWDSIIDASKELNISNTSISNCLKGRCKTACGYRWKYAENK